MQKYTTQYMATLSLMLSFTAKAESTTCAERMHQQERHAIAMAISVPAAGWMVGLTCNPDAKKQSINAAVTTKISNNFQQIKYTSSHSHWVQK